MPMVALPDGWLYASRMKPGKVIIQSNSLIQDHELKVGHILAQAGHDVVFLPVTTGKSPDIKYRGKIWEIKSPKGSKRRTIENNIRNALKQSQNVIIDLSRTQRADSVCIRDIQTQIEHRPALRSVIVINKAGRVIALK